MSSTTLSWAFAAVIAPEVKSVLVALAWRADLDDRGKWPPLANVCLWSGLTVGAVKTAIGILEDRKLLEINRTFNGRKLSYRINTDKIKDMVFTEAVRAQ